LTLPRLEILYKFIFLKQIR